MNFQMALEKLSFLKKRFKVIFFKKEKKQSVSPDHKNSVDNPQNTQSVLTFPKHQLLIDILKKKGFFLVV